MNTILHGYVPATSTRLSVDGGKQLHISPWTTVKFGQAQGVPQLAGARLPVGPLSTVGGGNWVYPGQPVAPWGV